MSLASVYCELSTLNATNLEILKHIDAELTVKELQEKLYLSRSALNARLATLYKLGLLQRRALPYKRIRYVYWRSPDVTSMAIECVFRKLNLDEYLKFAKSNGSANSAHSYDSKPVTVVQDIQRELTALVQRIATLDVRLTQAESVFWADW